MKRAFIITAAAILSISQCCLAEIELSIDKEQKHKIELSEPAKEINEKLFDSKDDMLKYYLQTQKKMDIEDIKILWESTVQRNPVIMFALKKLTMPPEKRRFNSSRMTKTIATLLRGAAMLPGLFGADSLTASASSVGGGLAGRYIINKDLPKEMPITDTELIQLARLVEDLQDKLIQNYYDYKANLETYKQAKANTEKFNNSYSEAVKTNQLAEMMTFRTLYNKAVRKESEAKQKVKLNRLQLERLAGVEPLNKLNLGKPVIKNEIKPQAINANAQTNLMTGKIDYYDVDINTLADEIATEMQKEKAEILADLQILWVAAVENSETIRFAILKLSNPEGEEVKQSAVKQILSPLASVAPIIGLGLGDPLTAGSAMFSGNLLNSVLSDNSEINAHLTKVTDADLVLLAKETDSLQEKLIKLYHNYVTSIIDLKLIEKMVKEGDGPIINLVKTSRPDLKCVADVFQNDALDLKCLARKEVLSRRMALEQFVGNEALIHVDKNIQDRLCYKL